MPARPRRLALGIAALAAGAALAATAWLGVRPTASGTAEPNAPSGAPATHPPAAPHVDATQAQWAAWRAYQAMTPKQRAGQLFMLGVNGTDPYPQELADIAALDAGNVYLRGESVASAAQVKAVTAALVPQLSHQKVRPFIGADQEGGAVQRLNGDGFSGIPSALVQGRSTPAQLEDDAYGWGRELASAGVNVDLAPDADTVPAGVANAPIGASDREYGDDPAVVGAHAAAFVKGMQAAGVSATVKHFPGLGRASGNTDSEIGVTDPTTADDPLLRGFSDAIAADPRFVMVSSAIYPAIDPSQPGCFSPAVIAGLLRGTMGYDGLVVSDSFGSAAVSEVTGGNRAVRFLKAGGTMILNSAPEQLQSMELGVLRTAKSDPAFATTVRAAVMKVLVAKAELGLIG